MKRASLLSVAVLVILTLVVSGVASVFAQSTTKSLSTNYTVQNLSLSEPAIIHVSYSLAYDGTTPGGTWNADAGNTDFTVAPGLSKVVAQYLDSTMVDGAGAAVIEGSQPIAAIVNMAADLSGRGNNKLVPLVTEGREEGKTQNMVPMGVRNQDGGFALPLSEFLLKQIIAQ